MLTSSVPSSLLLRNSKNANEEQFSEIETNVKFTIAVTKVYNITID